MSTVKKEIIDMLNQALRLEHAARIQYLAHAELIKGECAEGIVARLKELASDEAEHQDKFRMLIATYLGGEPIMDMEETHSAEGLQNILKVNLKDEKAAIDFYKSIYRKVVDNKAEFPYCFEKLEHEIRHIILDEEEHVTEIETLLGE